LIPSPGILSRMMTYNYELDLFQSGIQSPNSMVQGLSEVHF
jgi:hypothetical protein